MIRTIIWFLKFGISLLLLVPKSKKVDRLKEEGRTEEKNKLVDEVVGKWARMLIRASGSQVRVLGQEKIPKDETVLFVSNHQGNFDIPLLLGYIDVPKAFMAKVELSKIPFITKWMEHMECVFMDRENARKSLVAIKDGIKKLKAGYSMVVFPEGTRSQDGSVGDFKQGAFKLATKSKVRIVPVTINGSKDIMKKNSLLIRPSKVDIVVADPVSITEDYINDTAKLSDDIRSIIVKNLKK